MLPVARREHPITNISTRRPQNIIEYFVFTIIISNNTKSSIFLLSLFRFFNMSHFITDMPDSVRNSETSSSVVEKWNNLTITSYWLRTTKKQMNLDLLYVIMWIQKSNMAAIGLKLLYLTNLHSRKSHNVSFFTISGCRILITQRKCERCNVYRNMTAVTILTDKWLFMPGTIWLSDLQRIVYACVT